MTSPSPLPIGCYACVSIQEATELPIGVNHIAKAPKAKPKAPKAKAKAPSSKAKAEAPKAKAKRPLPLAPIGSYRDGSPRLLKPRAAKKARVIQDSSHEEDSSNDSEAADIVEAGRF